MSVFHHLLRRSAGLFALGLALALVLGSLCPRGWFVCVHEQTVVLADAGHAADEHGCVADDCCPDECPDEDGCLDLAISLVFDDQTAASSSLLSLPVAPLIEFLPDATRGIATLESPCQGRLGDPPLLDLIRHVRLLV